MLHDKWMKRNPLGSSGSLEDKEQGAGTEKARDGGGREWNISALTLSSYVLLPRLSHDWQNQTLLRSAHFF